MNKELETFEALCWAKVHDELPASRESEFTTGLATIPGAPERFAAIKTLHKKLLAAAAVDDSLESFEDLCWANLHGELPATREPEFTAGHGAIPGASERLADIEALHKHLFAAAAIDTSEAGEDALTDAFLRQIEADHQPDAADETYRGVLPFPALPASPGSGSLPPVGNEESADCHPLALASGNASAAHEDDATKRRFGGFIQSSFPVIAGIAAAVLLFMISFGPTVEPTATGLGTSVEFVGWKDRGLSTNPNIDPNAASVFMDDDVESACKEFDKLFLLEVEPEPRRSFHQVSRTGARIDVFQGDEIISQRFKLTDDISALVATFVQENFTAR